MDKAINLCDIGYRFLKFGRLEEAVAAYKRIYLGSYYCERYFLLTSQTILRELKRVASKTQKKVTLVIPISSEINLLQVKECVRFLLRKYKELIDTVVVNDLGMLQWVSENDRVSLVMGRLFSKSLRDPRYPDTIAQYVVTNECERLIVKYHCVGVEVEGCFQKIIKTDPNLKYKIYMHTPAFYMSCMRQCFFASIKKPIDQKFAPNAVCGLECSEYRLLNKIQENIIIHRIGKGVYFSLDSKQERDVNDTVLIEIPLERW